MKNKHKNNHKQSKQYCTKRKKKESFIKKWYFWLIVGLLVALITFLAIFIPNKIKSDREARELAEIEACTVAIGIDSLEFKTTCYESKEYPVPEDIKKADMNKVDMILAQANYDECRAFAYFVREALWDLNDDVPENLVSDSINSSNIDYIDTTYNEVLDSCNEKYSLLGAYNNNWDTNLNYRLSGWIHDYTNVQVFDLENSQGTIPEAVGVRADERTTKVPKNVGSVAYMAAYDFKQKHNNWWY